MDYWWCYDSVRIAAECSMVATRDYSSMLCVSAAVTFLQKLGGVEVVARRNIELCRAMVELLAVGWGTQEFR